MLMERLTDKVQKSRMGKRTTVVRHWAREEVKFHSIWFIVIAEHTTVPWRSGYRGGLLSRFPLGAQVRILPASKLFPLHFISIYKAADM